MLMKIFIDTANIDEIREAESLGIISGVTTNPSLIAKEGRDFKEVIKEIVKIVDGPVSAEVLSLNHTEIVAEGIELAAIHKNVVIKLPATLEGLKACYQFSKLGIKTNLTLIFTANQALLAARAGASFVSPFVGRLDDTGVNGISLIEEIRYIFELHNISTEIIGASIRNPLHAKAAATAGAHIGTLPYKVIVSMLAHPLTDAGIEKFLADWKSVPKN